MHLYSKYVIEKTFLIDIKLQLWYHANMDYLRKNQIFTVSIDGYSTDAAGVCHIDGCAVFVPGAIPGEQWEIKILKVLKDRAYAKAEKLLVPSPSRVKAECPHFGKCGGCDSLHLSYNEELRFKLERVNDCLARIGKQSVMAEEIIGSDNISGYRNKAILAVGSIGKKAVSGFFRERSHQIIPVERCLLQDEFSRRAAAAVTEFMDLHQIPAYDEFSDKGIVRHVFTRRALHTEDRLLCIVARKGFGDKTQALVEHLRSLCPELSGIVLNINKSKGNTVLSGDFYTLWGKDYISDILCGHSFDIAPQAFFQINPPQAEKLYNRAVEYADLDSVSLAFDLYCGAGTISLCLAEKAGKVIGAEIVPEAIENARENAARNCISNAEFICADAGAAALMLKERGEEADVVVVDPPRKGMYEEAVTAVASMAPKRIVYVSCDPATLSRDILRFETLGYKLSKVTAVDMFPRTRHVEAVALMLRTD